MPSTQATAMNPPTMLNVLKRLLDRLYVSLFNGPAMNARCHASRQRVDFLAPLKALQAPDRDQTLTCLFTDGSVTIPATIPPFVAPVDPSQKLTPEQEEARDDWDTQEAMLDTLRSIRADANSYFEDHGEPCLAVGHPLISIPPNAAMPGGAQNQNSGRILAPLLFMPVKLAVASRAVTIAALHEGAERHLPNPALVAWLERLGGTPYEPLPEDHEDAGKWWKQAEHLLAWVQHSVGIPADRAFVVNPQGTAEPVPATDELGGEIRVLPSAVLGLFPLTHHAVIQDTLWMMDNVNALPKTVAGFLDPRAFDVPVEQSDAREDANDTAAAIPARVTDHTEVFLVASADPCQMQAVGQARNSPALVIHGPPGTGKSQTIANIIGDCLARGERVLFVCDKRTALDEVRQRLEAAGLGHLCGVVHDPSADRTAFYRNGSARLANLRAATLPDDPTRDLKTLNVQLNLCQEELERYRQTLHGLPQDGGLSFHDLVGEWLGLVARSDHQPLPDDVIVDHASLGASRTTIEEVLQRSENVGHGANPFVWTLALTPADLMQRSSSAWLDAMGKLRDAAKAADALAPRNAPPLDAQAPLAAQAGARREAAHLLRVIHDSGVGAWAVEQFQRGEAVDCGSLLPCCPQPCCGGEARPAREVHLATPDTFAAWPGPAPAAGLPVADSGSRLRAVHGQSHSNAVEAVRGAMEQPLDVELRVKVSTAPLPALSEIERSVTVLEAWTSASFFTCLFNGEMRKAVKEIVASFGLDLRAAPRVLTFFRGLRARLAVAQLLTRHGAVIPDDAVWQDQHRHAGACSVSERQVGNSPALPAQTAIVGGKPPGQKLGQAPARKGTPLAAGESGLLLRHLNALDAVLVLRSKLDRDPAWSPLKSCVGGAMRFAWALGDAATLLDASALHIAALASTLDAVAAMKLFQPGHVTTLEAGWKAGEPAARAASAWVEFTSSLEGVARLHDAVAKLPAALHGPVRLFVDGAASMDTAWASLRCHAAMRELRGRFQKEGDLARIDGARVTAAFETMLINSRRKPALVRDVILRHWLRIQKHRLVHPTRAQLGELGFALRDRLALPRQGRLTFRRMLEAGSRTPGGDPLYDMCPVWMASPSTVAQIFPREAIFDVVIFDEASQCRLEHALPVLLRGKRVVIAGDPKQLPPTRFFEARRPNVIAADDDDECAATAPVEAEDLLSAALNLRMSESHLDIHYRSQNAALIGFSNEHYYRNRLQPLPAHPRNRVTETPIKLQHVGGTYTKSRTNPAEAAAIVKKVAELLQEADAPSIGIACFNLPQRNAILKALEKQAATDSKFARLYAKALERQDRGTFQGLFVKNLENVQGAERDVMLISTTFAPKADSTFTQHFGALSQQGGDRRLNVLVTRARHAIHIFTSIPKEKYQFIAPETELSPDSGRSLLYAYLRYAEGVTAHIERFQDSIEKCRRDEPATVTIGDTAVPSRTALGLGAALFEQHGIGSRVHWGSDGFAIDVACIHPHLPADVTIGVLADFTRYPKTHDPIAWDVFRTTMLEGQGWELHRVWTPQLFWRHAEHLEELARAHQKHGVPGALVAMV